MVLAFLYYLVHPFSVCVRYQLFCGVEFLVVCSSLEVSYICYLNWFKFFVYILYGNC